MHNTIGAIKEYPNETSVVGRLLLFYAELEFELCQCLAAVLDDNDHEERLNRAGKAFYLARGEEYRIVVADALIRPKFKEASLEPPYSEFIGDLRYCKAIRNQYAHCHWVAHKEHGLCFMAFEEGAKNTEFRVELRGLNAKLLAEQGIFFGFVFDGLRSLRLRYEERIGRSTTPPPETPKKLDRPKLFNPTP